MSTSTTYREDTPIRHRDTVATIQEAVGFMAPGDSMRGRLRTCAERLAHDARYCAPEQQPHDGVLEPVVGDVPVRTQSAGALGLCGGPNAAGGTSPAVQLQDELDGLAERVQVAVDRFDALPAHIVADLQAVVARLRLGYDDIVNGETR